MKRDIQLESMIDSKIVLDVVTKDGRTSELRLQIYFHVLKESYEKGELARI